MCSRLVLCLIFSSFLTLCLGGWSKEYDRGNRVSDEKSDKDDSGYGDDTLILVHTVFRHGERTVDPSTLYPTDPYKNETYYPYGIGQLTNEGKQREYRIGKALRRRYNKFLGPIYTPDLIDARSTAFNRTKMSLELALAGLFPPLGDQLFQPGLYWQPIPYNYWPRSEDKIFFSVDCPNYKKLLKEYLGTKMMRQQLHEHKDLFAYLSRYSGWNITNYGDIFYLYFGLRSEREWGFDLPEWAKYVYPQPLESLVVNHYFASTATKNLKSLSTGYFLKKIIEDTQAKITGNLKPEGRKMFLYSGHEHNIANLLTTLNIFEPKIPPYGCYVIMEVHRINGVYGIKIFFQDYTEKEPYLLKLPYCDAFCPWKNFISIVNDYIPSDDFCGFM